MRPRIYYSTHHLWSAKSWAEESARIEESELAGGRLDPRLWATATAGIFSAVAFLESAVNELFQDAFDDHVLLLAPIDPGTREALAGFWRIMAEHSGATRSRFGTTEKFDIALTIMGHEPFDHDAELYRNVRLLIRVQNALVHYKPLTLQRIDHSRFEDDLLGRFPLRSAVAARAAEAPFFPDAVLGAGIVAWGIEHALAYTDAFFRTVGITPNYATAEIA